MPGIRKLSKMSRPRACSSRPLIAGPPYNPASPCLRRPPGSPSMTRTLSTVRLALVLTMACFVAPVAWSVSTAAGAVASVDTPLPAGWQLCVLQGLTGRRSAQANVSGAWRHGKTPKADPDGAAYNPFNTRRTTNAADQSLPNVISSKRVCHRFCNWPMRSGQWLSPLAPFSVLLFNETKGFGFIVRERGADVFVHVASIIGEGLKTLSEGDRVSFDVEEGPKGLEARNVVKIS